MYEALLFALDCNRAIGSYALPVFLNSGKAFVSAAPALYQGARFDYKSVRVKCATKKNCPPCRLSIDGVNVMYSIH